MEIIDYLHIGITGKCNLNCKYCYNKKYSLEEKEDLSLKNILNLIEEVEPMGLKKIVLSGGEPLLSKNLLKILNYVNDKKIISSILTNGIELTPNFVKELEKIETFKEIRISYDGSGNEKIRGIKPIEIEKKLKLFDLSRIELGVNTILTSKNYNQILEMYETLKTTNTKLWRLDLPFREGNLKDNYDSLEVPIEKYNILFKELNKLITLYTKESPKFRLEIMFAGFKSDIISTNKLYFSKPDEHPCEYQKTTLTVKPDGGVTFCPSFPFDFGNIKNMSIQEILNSPTRKQFLDLKIKDLKKCQECEYIDLCGGGCRADSYYNNGSFLAEENPACEHYKYFENFIIPVYPQHFQNLFKDLIARRREIKTKKETLLND